MMKQSLNIKGNRYLVDPIVTRAKMRGLIHLPDVVADETPTGGREPTDGIVLECGTDTPYAHDPNNADIIPGTRIMWEKEYAVHKYGRWLIIGHDHVIAVID